MQDTQQEQEVAESVTLITKEQAAEAVRRCAFQETNDDGSPGRRIVHNFIVGGMFLIGADWDEDAALALIERAGGGPDSTVGCAWVVGTFGRCLNVRAEREPGSGEYVQYEFDTVRPEAAS